MLSDGDNDGTQLESPRKIRKSEFQVSIDKANKKDKAFEAFMGLVGDPFGQKYADMKNRKLSIGNQISRRQRENMLSVDMKKKPGVGKYFPQYGLVTKRPQT